MTSEQSAPNVQSSSRRDQELDGRYGQIGISAVAAAVRCQKFGSTAEPQRVRDERVERAPRAA
jgi:hypothetical protein